MLLLERTATPKPRIRLHLWAMFEKDMRYEWLARDGWRHCCDTIRRSQQNDASCFAGARFEVSVHCPLPLLTPVAATVTETSKPHHACSPERTDQVPYSGDRAHTDVYKCGKRSHNISPYCGGSSPPNAQNPKRGAAGRFGESACGIGAAAPRFEFKRNCN